MIIILKKIRKQIPFKTETSFYETLLQQLGLLKLDEKEQR